MQKISVAVILLVAAFLFTSCGHDEKKVVLTPAPTQEESSYVIPSYTSFLPMGRTTAPRLSIFLPLPQCLKKLLWMPLHQSLLARSRKLRLQRPKPIFKATMS